MFAVMHKFNSDGVEIAYETAGDGPPILLVHGFASTGRVNWWDTGWVKTLTEAGRQVITFDNRGHGASQKLYESRLYPATELAEDARRLLDHLGIVQADVMGYSMGARVAAFLMFAGIASLTLSSALWFTAMAANPLGAEIARGHGLEIGFGSWLVAASVPTLVAMATLPWLLFRLIRPEVSATPEAPRAARSH